MNVFEALNSRHTVRAYLPDPVDEKVIVDIMAAATRTPSWANTQPWEIFVTAGERLERLRSAVLTAFREGEPPGQDMPRPETWPPLLERRMRELGQQRFEALGIGRGEEDARRAQSEMGIAFFGAPAVAFLCMDKTLTAWSVFDLGMLAQSIMLAAAEHCLGTAVAFAFVAYPQLIRAELGVPENLSVVIGIALGKEDEDHVQNSYRSPRRPVTEVVRTAGFSPGQSSL